MAAVYLQAAGEHQQPGAHRCDARAELVLRRAPGAPARRRAPRRLAGNNGRPTTPAT